VKAIVQDEYGSPDVLVVAKIDKLAVGDDEVLVRQSRHHDMSRAT
jgi:NADPH:quinone reductase-like Zn-dependent oxidoreductase